MEVSQGKGNCWGMEVIQISKGDTEHSKAKCDTEMKKSMVINYYNKTT